MSEAGYRQPQQEPGKSRDANGGKQFPVPAPGEIGEEGKRKELEDGGGADEHPAVEVLATLPAGPRAGEQQQQERVHASRQDTARQRKEGRYHGGQAEELRAPWSADDGVYDQQAGRHRRLDQP